MAHPLRIAFAGTPEFSLAALDAVASSPHKLIGVWTQPDRPAGRGRQLTASPVKRRALELKLPVHQPENFKSEEARQAVRDATPDVMVVVAYGLILPKSVLAIPRYGCLNIHASLLPRWRGAAPIQRAILAGDAESGVAIMQMDKGLDTGDVLLEKRTPIGEEDDAQSLHDRLATLGAQALIEVLDALPQVQPRRQDAAGVTYAAKLTKEEARLDWTRTATELARAVRGYNPWPVAYTVHLGQPLRIWRAIPVTATAAQPPGTVLKAGREGIDVAAGEGVLRVLQMQPAGGRVQSAAEFANGRDLAGARFGG
ncbi:MAG TPA: methionyl-tRNA formyltransferase [Gammaproteobacteria bacterium]|nr:methionyl-tRNA formyltransferase [Gammaproteobacteria bacterium]